MIDTATNTVVATIPVGNTPVGVGIVPPPLGVPFLAFNAVLNIDFGTAPNTDAFTLGTDFTLSSTAPAVNPLTQPITPDRHLCRHIRPALSTRTGTGIFSFEGVINGVTMKAVIKSTGTLRYNFQVGAQLASLTGTQNAVYVTLAFGGGSFSNSNSVVTSVRIPSFSIKSSSHCLIRSVNRISFLICFVRIAFVSASRSERSTRWTSLRV